jgi:iron complex outermembrane recepter protein
MTTRDLVFRLGLSVALVAVAPLSFAQTAELEEVVVTAQKRSQDIRDVPISISAFTPEFLERNNINDFGDLFLFTPGFSSSPNYSYHIYSSIRGISSTDFGFGADPSIGFYVNGVHTGRYGTQVASYYDIERVEVVKGPQNTLFGRSSIAGAISMITKRPTNEFEAEADVSLGNIGRKELTGIVNVPISDNFAMRAAAYWLDKDGFVRNVNGGDDLAPSEIKAGRVSFRYRPTDRIDAQFILNYEDRRETGNFYSREGLPEFVVESTLRGDENKSNFKVGDATLDLAFELSDRWRLNSLSNYRDVEADYAEDYDGLAQVIGGPYYQNQDVGLFNQELRLSYENERGAAFFVGASYFDEDMTAAVDEWVDTTFAFTGTFNAMQAANSYANAFVERGEYDVTAKGWSVFADGSIPFGERFTFTAGIRYNRDEKDFTIFVPDPATLAANAAAPFPCGCYLYGLYTSSPLSLSRSWSDTSVRAALNFELTDTVTAYAAYSQGWKAGGIESFKFNLPPMFPLFFGLDLAAAGGTPRSYNPETSDNFEIGVKGAALDRRLQFSAAVYHYKYEDLQRSVFNGATAVIENIGAAKATGFEGELRIRPFEVWDLFASAGYNDSEITEDNTPQQLGLPLNRAPKLQYVLGTAYRLPVAWGGGGEIEFSGNYAHQDKFRTDNALTENVPSYGIGNASIAYSPSSDRYSVELFIDNIADKYTYGRRLDVTPFVFPVPTTSVIGKPREYGIKFRYRFGDLGGAN